MDTEIRQAIITDPYQLEKDRQWTTVKALHNMLDEGTARTFSEAITDFEEPEGLTDSEAEEITQGTGSQRQEIGSSSRPSVADRSKLRSPSLL